MPKYTRRKRAMSRKAYAKWRAEIERLIADLLVIADIQFEEGRFGK